MIRELTLQNHCPKKLNITVMMLLLVTVALSGCTRSLRSDAAKVAKAGSANAKQMVQFYESLQQDTVDTYELTAFRTAYLRQKALPARPLTEEEMRQLRALEEQQRQLEEQLAKEFRKTYEALVRRKQLAQAMQNAYDSYANLSEYNAAQEVVDGLDGLIKTVRSVTPLALADPTGTAGAAASVVEGIIKDIVRELETLKQNRKLLTESGRLVPILQKLKKIFDEEKVLYGGDKTLTDRDGKVLKDENGKEREISGIAGRRAAAYKSVAVELISSDAVVSTALINRVLGQYQLRWPEPQLPFSQPALKAGAIKIIESRARPLAQLSEEAADGISRGLGKLITLHGELTVKKPLSLSEFIDNSATVQVVLDQLKARGISTEALIELLKALEKGAENG